MRIRNAGVAAVSLAALVMSGIVPGAAAQPLPGAPSTAQAPTELKVEGQASKALLDTTRPGLSWTVNDRGRDEAQTAYEVRVVDLASDRDPRGKQVWDSAKVTSSANVGVQYAGPALQSDHTYEWSVRTWNSQHQASPWSAPERFDVGLLTVSDWQASWLQASDGALVRRDFTAAGPVVRARLYLGAQGLVEPHLNGAQVAPKDVLASSVTDYAKRVVYREYDVTNQVHPGANALAVMLGKGQYSGTPTFIAQLDLTYANGTHAVVATDADWKTAAGPVTRDDFYDGESWDARKQIAGWDAASFDDSAWASVPVFASVSAPASLALNKPVTSLDATVCCGWSPAALVDGIDMSTDQSEGYHSGIETTPDVTKWVQVDLGSDQQIAKLTLFPARPTNDPSGDFPGIGFPVRYEVQVSDDPTFATATTVVDNTGSDQPNPGTSPVSFDVSVTARYVRVTATVLNCEDGGCTFRLAELGVYAPQPALTWGLTQLTADTSPPEAIVGSVKPVASTTPVAGATVYDFGDNYVGQIKLSAKAPAGTKVTVVKGEILTADGQVTTSNISGSPADAPRQVDDYTFDGSGTQTWMPNFNYAGFRYAEVTGLPAGTAVSVVAELIHTDVAQTGSFTTSNPLLNQIQNAVVQTQVNDLQGMPVDCPTREKHGWLGDAADSDTEALANFDMQSLYTKWLGDIQTSINPDGSVPAAAPDQGDGTSFASDPAWGTALPQVTWDSYLNYGDPTVLSDNYTQIKNWVDYMGTVADSDHIVVNSAAWGDDWLATVSTPHSFFQTLFYMVDSRLLANMATVLGKTADATTYNQLADAIAAGFTSRYFDASTNTYSPDTELAYAMPLVLGVVPAGHEQAVLNKLVANIVANSDHLTTGFVGTTYVYQALGMYHRNDVALAISERTDYPSFGYMLANGPGTIWEKWPDSSAADGTSSKDHIGLGGSIGRWYYEQLAGIQPGTPGWTTFTLAPSVVGDLTHVSAKEDTVRGTVASSWSRIGNTVTFNAQVPVGATATVDVPLLGGANSTVTEGGHLLWAAGHPVGGEPGVTVKGVVDGALQLTVGSGHYTFVATAPRATTTSVSITTATGTTSVAPGASADIPVAVDASSTHAGSATLGAQVPTGWTVSSTPQQIPVTAAPAHTLATVHLTPPADTQPGIYPINLTVTAPDGTTATTQTSVDVHHTNVLYDFESGTQGWQPTANVGQVDAVTSFANGPGTPHGGTQALEADSEGVDASQWRTVSVTPDQPLDLSTATHLSLWMDSYGGLPGAATYQAQVVLHAGSQQLSVTTPINHDAWNQIDVDVSNWAPRNAVTSIDVSFSAVGSTIPWAGNFDIDDVQWTDQVTTAS